MRNISENYGEIAALIVTAKWRRMLNITRKDFQVILHFDADCNAELCLTRHYHFPCYLYVLNIDDVCECVRPYLVTFNISSSSFFIIFRIHSSGIYRSSSSHLSLNVFHSLPLAHRLAALIRHWIRALFFAHFTNFVPCFILCHKIFRYVPVIFEQDRKFFFLIFP